MGASGSTMKISEEEVMSMRREFLYECSIFILARYFLKEPQNNYQNSLLKSRMAVQHFYELALNNEVIEKVFCLYLMNRVNLKKQKVELGAGKIRDFKNMISRFVTVYSENIILGPGGELDVADGLAKERPFWDANLKYYKDVWNQKVAEIGQSDVVAPPEGGWTFDTWNQAKSANFYKYLQAYDDPELQIYTTVHRRVYGIEVFHSGSVKENVVTTLLDHPQYGDTDVDIMFCFPIPTSTFHDICERPAYTRIKLPQSNTEHLTDKNNYMLSSDKNLARLKVSQEDQDARTFSVIPGPAIGLFRDSAMTLKAADYVSGFYRYDRAWPAVAEEWRHRDRSKLSGWPTQALIDRAMSHGTYLVPVAHKNSDNPDIEWRYSFSKPEIDLMLNISKTQRKCYMLTKRMCQLISSGFKIFSSYFVKTSFFWMLEEMPTIYWTRMTMTEMIEYLLDKMIFFFAEHYLPHYFIRKANIIDHLPQEHIKTVRQKLKSLRLQKNQGLPEYVRGDVCLCLINDEVEPC